MVFTWITHPREGAVGVKPWSPSPAPAPAPALSVATAPRGREAGQAADARDCPGSACEGVVLAAPSTVGVVVRVGVRPTEPAAATGAVELLGPNETSRARDNCTRRATDVAARAQGV